MASDLLDANSARSKPQTRRWRAADLLQVGMLS
jgi:hypothetical protein